MCQLPFSYCFCIRYMPPSSLFPLTIKMQHNFKNKQLKTKNLTEKVSAAITLYNISYLHNNNFAFIRCAITNILYLWNMGNGLDTGRDNVSLLLPTLLTSHWASAYSRMLAEKSVRSEATQRGCSPLCFTAAVFHPLSASGQTTGFLTKQHTTCWLFLSLTASQICCRWGL